MTTTVDTATKRCSNCKTVKARDAFSPKPAATDGLNAWCRTCNTDDQREKRHQRAEADRVVLDLPRPPRDWRDDADQWFAEGSGPTEKAAAREAKAVCATCPVRHPCGLWALGFRGPLAGIWGGWTEEDRRSIKRARAGTT